MKTDVEMFDEIGPGWKAVIVELLNAISDAQDRGLPRIVVTLDLDHETKNVELTIFDVKIGGGDLLQ